MSVRREKYKDSKTGQVKSYWRVDVKARDPEGNTIRKRPSSKTWNKTDALAEEARIRRAIREGTLEKKEMQRTKFSEFVPRFMLDYSEVNDKPGEFKSKESIFRVHLIPAFKQLYLDEIVSYRIEQYKSEKNREGKSRKTINNHLSVLRKTLLVAQEWRFLETVPDFKWLKVPEPDFDYLEFEEKDKLVGAADPVWRPMISVGLETGMRMGELRALRKKDVHLKTGLLQVRRAAWENIIGTPKSWRIRDIPLTRTAVCVLKESQKLKGELVFSNPDGSLLTRNQCKRPLWRVCQRAGLRKIGWHVLRHSFASHLAMLGVPMKAIQELLGHKNVKTTMRYAHLSPAHRSNAIAVLEIRGQIGAKPAG